MELSALLATAPDRGAVLHRQDGRVLLIVPGPGHRVQILLLRPCPNPSCDCRDIPAVLMTADESDRIDRIDAGGLWMGSGTRVHRPTVDAAEPPIEVLVLFDEGGVVLREGSEPREPSGASPDEVSLDLDGPYDERTTWVEAFLNCRVLDELAAAVVRAKGASVPTGAVAPAKLADEDLTQLTGWSTVHPSLRLDRFLVADRLLDVTDLHCLKPGCACTVVHLVVDEDSTGLGHAELDLATRTRKVVVGHAADGADVTEATRQWLMRYGWRGAQRRHQDMRAFAQTLDASGHWQVREAGLAAGAAVVGTLKVGRNEPCPCGSGRKFKRCCAGQA
ncbi:MAG: SEC-C metal-binding domain-containing protein [Myxococcota bacterium]